MFYKLYTKICKNTLIYYGLIFLEENLEENCLPLYHCRICTIGNSNMNG